MSESGEHLQAMNQSLVSLEKDPSNKDLIGTLFRSTHSIKGMAASMGYRTIAEVSHGMEDAMEVFRDDDRQISPKEVDLLFEGLDALDLLVKAVENDTQPEIDISALISKLSSAGKNAVESEDTDHLPESGPENANQSAVESAASEILNDPGETQKTQFNINVEIKESADIPEMRGYLVLKKLKELGEIVEMRPDLKILLSGEFGNRISIRVATEKSEDEIRSLCKSITCLNGFSIESVADLNSDKKEASKKVTFQRRVTDVQSSSARTVRVNTELLDNLINIVGEMIIARSRLFQIGSEIKSDPLEEAVTLMSNLIRDLHYQVMSVRMTPLETVMNRLPRAIRDISKKNGKEINLNIEGKTIELDRSIVDEIADPLIHILRNCVDHGIETPEERKKAGKSPSGNLLISAGREKDNVIINIKDDGRGMDPEKIKAIAVKKGLIKKERAELMTDRESFMLVCNPGLSTAETVTEVSGRGVGMDAVKKIVDSLSGRLEIDSTPGKGTLMTIKLPLTVAIVQALLVKICGYLFAIPINQVIRTTEAPKNKIKRSQKKFSVLLDDELVPLFSLKKILGIQKKSPHSHYASIVIVEIKNKKAGLVVDCLYGQQEVFIKPLDRPLKWVRGLSGATMLGDGSVVFVLDTMNLI